MNDLSNGDPARCAWVLINPGVTTLPVASIVRATGSAYSLPMTMVLVSDHHAIFEMAMALTVIGNDVRL